MIGQRGHLSPKAKKWSSISKSATEVFFILVVIIKSGGGNYDINNLKTAY